MIGIDLAALAAVLSFRRGAVHRRRHSPARMTSTTGAHITVALTTSAGWAMKRRFVLLLHDIGAFFTNLADRVWGE